MTAPIYTLAVKFVERYETDAAFRRDMQRDYPARYEASKRLIRVWDAADRRCPRPQKAMSDEHKARVVNQCMGSGQRREEEE